MTTARRDLFRCACQPQFFGVGARERVHVIPRTCGRFWRYVYLTCAGFPLVTQGGGCASCESVPLGVRFGRGQAIDAG
jgi:hypothetical protein